MSAFHRDQAGPKSHQVPKIKTVLTKESEMRSDKGRWRRDSRGETRPQTEDPQGGGTLDVPPKSLDDSHHKERFKTRQSIARCL